MGKFIGSRLFFRSNYLQTKNTSSISPYFLLFKLFKNFDSLSFSLLLRRKPSPPSNPTSPMLSNPHVEVVARQYLECREITHQKVDVRVDSTQPDPNRFKSTHFLLLFMVNTITLSLLQHVLTIPSMKFWILDIVVVAILDFSPFPMNRAVVYAQLKCSFFSYV